MAPPLVPLHERFWEKVDRRGPDECWPWLGHVVRKGYGRIRLSGREGGQAPAHRVAFMLAVGPIPEGLWVLHRCDNPPCCNPVHLFLGDHQDNVDDKVAKGRQPRGSSNGSSRLTEEQVVEIRRRRAAGEGIKALARAFGVSKRTVQFIDQRRTWAHIGVERQPGARGY